MPSCYRVCLAVALALAAGWFNIAAAVGTGQAEGNLVIVTALKVQPADAQMTKVLIEGSAQFTYQVLRPEQRLVTVDLYGVDASKLQSISNVGGRLVDSIQVKSVGLPGKAAARVEINLIQPCDIKSRFESNALALELVPMGNKTETTATATEARSNSNVGSVIRDITTDMEEGVLGARILTDGKVQYKHFRYHQPERLVIDIQNVKSSVAQRVIDVNKNGVERIRIGNPSSSATRVVFDLKEDKQYLVSDDGQGLTIRIGDGEAIAKADKAVPEKVISTPSTLPSVEAKNALDASRARRSPATPKESAVEPKVKVEEKEVAANVGPELKPATFTRTLAPSPTAPAPSTGRRNKPQAGGIQFGDPAFQGEPISLDITGVDLSDILRFVSDNYDVNFVLDKSVQRVEVTIKVNNVPWGQVLNSIFKANRLSYKREELIVRVATIEAFKEEEKQNQERKLAQIENLPLITEYFQLRYEQVGVAAGGTGVGLRSILSQNLSSRGNISVNPRTNMMIITDIPDRIERAKEIIARLDVPQSQVEIEARIVQANRSFLRDLGIQLFTGVVSSRGGGIGLSTAAGASTAFNFVPSAQTGGTTQQTGIIRGRFTPRDFISDGLFVGPLASGALGGRGTDTVLSLTTGLIGTGFISTAITAAENKGIAKTISSPRVTVQNNSQGVIRSGLSIPYTAAQNAVGQSAIATTTFQEATLSLTITPQITSEGNVLLRLESSNDSINNSLLVNGQPPINRQSTNTIVLVPDGGTTIIGGVNIDSESNTQTRTPGVSSIPLIGNLFKQRFTQRQTSELLFFITPRVFRGETFLTTGGEPAHSPAPIAQPNPGGQP